MKNKDRSHLKLVQSEEVLEETIEHKPIKELVINSFWNTCGEKQDGFPCQVCSTEKVGHEWSIVSPEYNNCFWEFVRARSFSDGFMNPLSQAETAELMGCSPTAIHMLERSAIEKIKKSPYFEILRDYLLKEPQIEDTGSYSVTVPFEEVDTYDEE